MPEQTKRLPDPYIGGGLGFTSIGISQTNRGTSQELTGGGTISTIFEGSYWEIDISFPQSLRSSISRTIPFLIALEGSLERFFVCLPQYRNPKSGAWDLGNVGTISLQAPNIIRVSNWDNLGGSLEVGDMIKLSNSSKVYKITKTTKEGSAMDLTLSCKVRSPTTVVNALLEPNDILFLVTLKVTPDINLSSTGIYSGFSISLREVVEDY